MKDDIIRTRELITPQRAKDILETSEKTGFKNRPLSKMIVDRYARDMMQGRWKDNGKSITISHEGFLADGQHRLHALIKANVSLIFSIDYNVDKNTFDTIDIGKKRSIADFLYIDGVKKNATLVSAASRGIYNYLKTGVLGFYNGRSGDTGMYEYIYPISLTFYDDIQYCSKLYSRNKSKIINMSNLFSTYILFGFIDNKKRDIFFENVMKGVNLAENSIEYKLRTKLTDNRITKYAKISYYVEAIYIVRAWNSFFKKLKRIDFKIENNYFNSRDSVYFPEIEGFDRKKFIDSIGFTEEQKLEFNLQ